MQTLPDYLAPALHMIGVGLNPSLPSVQAGYYFANPRNRFWRALLGSSLLQPAPVASLQPGVAAMSILLEQYKLGFTDLVKRPTANGSELRAADYRYWAPILHERLLQYQPDIVWFHGKMALKYYMQYTQQQQAASLSWGQQAFTIGQSAVYVTPNSSPANAAYSLDKLIESYNALAAYRQQRALRNQHEK